jgi:hypothetical protein
VFGHRFPTERERKQECRHRDRYSPG